MKVICLASEAEFHAVGQFYVDFRLNERSGDGNFGYAMEQSRSNVPLA